MKFKYRSKCRNRPFASLGRLFYLSPLLAILSVIQPAFSSPLELESVDCIDFINERPARVSCGYVSAPLDHDKQPGATIRLPVLIAHSTRSMSQSTAQAVLIPGGGGPGASLGFGLQYDKGRYLAPYQSLRQAGFDVVLLDQRGAGLSTPTLTCPETVTTFRSLASRHRSMDEEITHYLQAIKECRLRFARSGIAVGSFDTRQSALDFLLVMDSLPYKWWGTVATSYATALAQTMLVINPAAFDRVVLDSPVPIDYQQPMTLERSRAAILKTLAVCNIKSECDSRYPDLNSKLDTIMQRARLKPYGIKIRVYSNSGRLRRTTLIVNDMMLISILANAIYNNEAIAALPRVIDQFHAGRKQSLAPFAENFWYQSTDENYADGLHMTVHCRERQPLEDRYLKKHPDELASLSTDSRAALRAQQEFCRLWKVSPDNSYTLRPNKRFTADTLILAGALDPVISRQDIKNTADDFANVTTSIAPHLGHAVWYQSECARRQTLIFLNGDNHVTSRNDCRQSQLTFD